MTAKKRESGHEPDSLSDSKQVIGVIGQYHQADYRIKKCPASLIHKAPEVYGRKYSTNNYVYQMKSGQHFTSRCGSILVR